MKRRNGLLRTFVIGALLSGVAWAVPAMQAQAGDLPVKAPAAAEPVPFWWFHGEVEVGGRFFLNDPPRNGSAYLGQNSLAKFYEYRDLRPGPFGNIWLSTGSSDGLYQIDLGGKNIGYNDQSYYLDASKAGQHYFNFSWDETPHLYSTSAQTPYLGVGTTTLTLPPGFLGTGAMTAARLAPFLQQTDIGIRRDTASAQYRWTPTDAWDVKADYSHMHRTGTQVDGIVGMSSGSFPYGPTSVPKPVDDTTQNYGLNGEYVGTSLWGKRFTFKVAYNGSTYTDDFSSYSIQNPYCTGATSATCAQTTQSPVARLSTWPSNNANAFSGTLGADLPWNSRYVGTVSYTMMRQNDTFIPMTNNPGPLTAAATAANNLLLGSSLNGAINTLLSNNIVTTKITPELTSKLSYRYYNFDNDTPMFFFPCSAPVTTNCGTAWIAYDQNTAAEKQIQTLSMQYTKQNAGADLNWRPTKEWNLGAAYGFERYDWTQADVDHTNEHSGKVFVDWKPASWFGVRSSGYYSVRRYGTYDYMNFVGNIQFPGTNPAGPPGTGNSYFYNPAYRQFMIDDRNRWKANVAFDVLVLPGITVSPNFKYQDDYYGLNGSTQMGLNDSRMWNAGVDVTFVVDPRTSFMFGYVREYYTQLLFGLNGGSNTALPTGTTATQTNDRTIVDTFTAAARYAAIPDKLDLGLRYTASRGVDGMKLILSSGAAPGGGGQFPDSTTWFQRLDATAVYTFDKGAVAQAGLQGVVKAKLNYVWERNSVTNWQNDPLAPFSPAVSTAGIWLAQDNPNYSVHQLMASLAYSW